MKKKSNYPIQNKFLQVYCAVPLSALSYCNVPLSVHFLRCTNWRLQVRLRSRIFIYLVWKVCQLQCINACKLACMTHIGYCADSDKTWHCHTIRRLWSFVVHPRQLCTRHELFPFQPAANSHSCIRTTLVPSKNIWNHQKNMSQTSVWETLVSRTINCITCTVNHEKDCRIFFRHDGKSPSAGFNFSYTIFQSLSVENYVVKFVGSIISII